METEELIKLVDGIYKNILDKFNPGARQMINAGKAYLKALHGAAAASRMYVDAISKLAKQAQQGTWGGSSDIGAALTKIVEVYKEIQDQQMNIKYAGKITKIAMEGWIGITPTACYLFLDLYTIPSGVYPGSIQLKAFYVDLLVPLETNLEKDTKVVQSEQKRFLQQHKQRSETYSKAAAIMKKQRKKSRGSTKTGLAMDKELKNMQVLEEEKTKLDAFCEQSLKNAMTQERRRYGFVLERQCSLAKHYLSYHSYGSEAYQQNIEKWSEVAKTREYLPESVENIFSNRLRQISVWQDEDLYSNPRSPNLEDDRISISSQLRKTKSMDASCLDIRSMREVSSPVTTMSRAKSEYNLNSSQQDIHTPSRRPKSMAVPPPPTWEAQLARALYAYLSSGENQLSFHEGDLIALIGDRNKGWQFGENLRTQCSGWFPLAYTEILIDDSNLSPSHRSDASSAGQAHSSGNNATTPTNMMSSGGATPSGNTPLENTTPARMFGDTLHLHRSSNNAKQIRRAIASNNIPPPGVPAPVPTPSLPYQKQTISQSHSATFTSTQQKLAMDVATPYSTTGIKSSASTFNFPSAHAGAYSTHPAPSRSDRPTAGAPLPLHLQTKGGKIGGPVGNVSLHSSNDSGFSNDPPPQPEVDYSDDDSIAGQTKMSNRRPRKEPQSQPQKAETLQRPHHNKTDPKKQATTPGMKQSNSHGNLIESRQYMTPDDASDVSKVKVKRTKSFWKFGKSANDNEILEGMSMWRHRDLVDLDDEKKNHRRNFVGNTETNKRKPSRDKSNDSDRTINNNNINMNGTDELSESKIVVTKTNSNRIVSEGKDYHPQAQKLSLPPRKDSEDSEQNYEEENPYEIRTPKPSRNNFDDRYYDDDGLMMKTVNRKNILQQYSDDISAEEDSEPDSDFTSDDPYDCILVEDQKVRKTEAHFPNVAELGKKLEKLSKTSKFSPNKEKNVNNIRNSIREKNDLNSKLDEDYIEYNDLRKSQSFKTFGIEIQNDENGEKERLDERYYNQNNKNNTNTNKRYSANNKNSDRQSKPSYESIESSEDMISKNNNTNRRKSNKDSKNERSNKQSKNKTYEKEKSKYYNTNDSEIHDEEVVENRQFLPRTKLSKTNSNTSRYSESHQDGGLMEYGETLQRRLKNPEYNSKYDEKSPHNGNMYGPWYDLWGLDASAQK